VHGESARAPGAPPRRPGDHDRLRPTNPVGTLSCISTFSA
jgi:hypothetical protein